MSLGLPGQNHFNEIVGDLALVSGDFGGHLIPGRDVIHRVHRQRDACSPTFRSTAQ